MGHNFINPALAARAFLMSGWMGRMTAGSGSSIYTQLMNVAGYPTDFASGNRLVWDDNNGNGATANNRAKRAG